MQPAIKVRDISKRFTIGRRRGSRTFREAIMENAAAPLQTMTAWFRGRTNEPPSGQSTDLWALRDVNFDVMPGELLGLVGRNGAGKSTLLKILSRITEPTLGNFELHGRVGSLLEVGTGFNFELTGRENIFLSGALLGMRRAEIQRQFDEIVAFAGVEDFVDTPVKRYSSGMAVRLGFAVAAHLQAEILLIDEVLAVGDFAFQRKCIGKMNDIARGSGRTIVFVSHNMAAIESLCNSVLLLKNGRLVMSGPPHETLARYVAEQTLSSSGTRSLSSHPGRNANCEPVMQSVDLYCGTAQCNGVVKMGSALSIIVRYAYHRPVRALLGMVFKTAYGVPVFCVSARWSGGDPTDSLQASQGRIVCTIDELRLMPGTYMLDLYLGEAGEDFDIIIDAISFDVVAADLNGTGRLAPPSGGPMFCAATFKSVPEEDNSSTGVSAFRNGCKTANTVPPGSAPSRI
jgi:lipopolysaccharide transport system ATP-binding protein